MLVLNQFKFQRKKFKMKKVLSPITILLALFIFISCNTGTSSTGDTDPEATTPEVIAPEIPKIEVPEAEVTPLFEEVASISVATIMDFEALEGVTGPVLSEDELTVTYTFLNCTLPIDGYDTFSGRVTSTEIYNAGGDTLEAYEIIINFTFSGSGPIETATITVILPTGIEDPTISVKINGYDMTEEYKDLLIGILI